MQPESGGCLVAGIGWRHERYHSRAVAEQTPIPDDERPVPEEDETLRPGAPVPDDERPVPAADDELEAP